MDAGKANPESDHLPAADSVPSFGQSASTSPSAERPRLTYILAGAAALAVMVAIATFVSRSRPGSSSAAAELTPEQKEYVAHISVSGARMSAATNFLGQKVIYLDAQVSNQGPRSVKQVEAKMDFADLFGQVIFREQVTIFPAAALPLKSGETRDFQLFFDRVPSEWNQAPPRITVTSVQFE